MSRGRIANIVLVAIVLVGCDIAKGAPDGLPDPHPASSTRALPSAPPSMAPPSAVLASASSAPTVDPSEASEATSEPEVPELPAPSCPSPPFDGKEPVVTASVSSGGSVRVTGISSSVVSCSTVASTDGVPTTPATRLPAHLDDQLTLALSSAWRVVRWSGYERGPAGDSVSIWPLTETPERPRSLAVFAIGKRGQSILEFELVAIRTDGSAVAQLSFSVRVDVT